MFLNNSPEFAAAWKKYGEYLPFFDPKFDEKATIYDKMFQMKKDMTPESFWNTVKSFPEVMQGIDAEAGKAFVRLNDDHWYSDSLGNEMLRCHYYNWKQEGEDYSCDVCFGS